ncbi:LysR family transcriptional regulator [Clostridium frigidicarnis]|uniref:DNA-binding transcriptional regulator, LysR family n=1 Tax=Clostridium frigidicarnis TaxID=84698 RepID=A0A1I1ACL7_9CLOT|nr:LysR family transcriptional regulator [Clostridium frigidicarnis]SFB35096.1 DNA-binding transcriptional regulator, LysR family [Clostridium frigidicarnis]
MNERRMRIFYEVSNVLNMTRVAEKMFISQSSISQAINELEQELGVKLFDRVSKRLYLTYEGQVFYNYVRRILNLYDESICAINDIRSSNRGKLKIGASNTVGVYMVPRIARAFLDIYENVEVSTTIGNTSDICNLILKNEIDFGLVEGKVKNDEIITNSFFKDELVVIVPKNHRLANKKLIRKEEIRNEKFIMREVGSGTRELIERKFKENDVEYNVFMELGNNEAIKNIVEAGIGISCISKQCLDHERIENRLKILNIVNLELSRDIYFIRHKDKNISTAMTNFMNILKIDKQ